MALNECRLKKEHLKTRDHVDSFIW